MGLKRHTREITKNVCYARKFTWFYSCVYCGEDKECVDHVFPISKTDGLIITDRKIFKQGLNLVPCCNECNVLASAEPFFNIKNKRRFIQNKLKRRYASILKTKNWSEEELDELGENLKRIIIEALKLKTIVEKRILWPNRNT